MNVIMKFGGTSVQDAEAMNRVINIVRNQWADNASDQPPIVVVSAMSKVTDRLVETGRLAGERQTAQATQIIADLLTAIVDNAEHPLTVVALRQGTGAPELAGDLANKASPSATQSMAGFCASSRCKACGPARGSPRCWA